jgi:endonuclease YncB( thermonuclease family)
MAAHLFIVLSFLFSVMVSPGCASEAFVGSVKKIIDGDSLLIVSANKTIEVRLYGIDCPEYRQPFSNAARKMVQTKVGGFKVLVQPEYYDKYERMVAIVHYGDVTLNSELVRAGLAWVSPYFCRRDICTSWQQLENSARASKRGLWREKEPVPPWEWKKMQHNN